MKQLRLSVAKLMFAVVIVALNFGAARTLFSYDTEMLIGVALSGLVLQASLFQLLRSRGRKRAFWAGFITCCSMAMMTLIWAMMFPRIIGIGFKNGATTRIETPGSPLYTIWYSYANFFDEHIIAPLLFDPRINPGLDRESVLGGAVIVAIRAAIWSLPQLLIAVAGGLLISRIVLRWDKKPADGPRLLTASLLPVART